MIASTSLKVIRNDMSGYRLDMLSPTISSIGIRIILIEQS